MLSAPQGAPLVEFAPAKVNLTLRVLGRRPDGYHEIESLVAFANVGDRVRLAPGEELSLSVRGPTAAAAGPSADNLVLRAARALADRAPNLVPGRFSLSKRLPVAAGLGGGSSDAAAALRLLARANHIPSADARLMQAAVATGADVAVCLDPRARVMRGIGDILSKAVDLEPLPALLVNPGVAVATRDVFAALRAGPIERAAPCHAMAALTRDALLSLIERQGNDLEPPALGLEPVIGNVLNELRALPGCRLARMSGSGATCFALFPSGRAAAAAARILRTARPAWWVRAVCLQ